MNIVMIGTGYVGLVSGACFAEMGNHATCIDTDREKIKQLKKGHIPIYEPGLENMIKHNTAEKRLVFDHNPKACLASADTVFLCVGTPPGEGGSADLSFVRDAAKTIGKNIENYTIIVTKSTVPVGTTAKVAHIVNDELAKRGSDASFDMVNNPEFLKEGHACADFMGPDRVVIGTNSERAKKVMRKIYAPFFRTDERIIFMSVESSELTKYASNCMLATRISFMNEIALLAEKVGADIEEIRQGIAHDKRIGKFFLYAGAGYGGACLPKDVSALIKTGQSAGCDMRIASAVNDINDKQKHVVVEKVLRYFGKDIHGKKIAMWGIAFKAETDDIREAPSIEVICKLKEAGAEFSVHDPKALENARKLLGKESITYHKDSYAALEGADILIIMTEWKEYRTPDWKRVKALLKNQVVFDGRNLYNPEDMKEMNFRYFGIGYGETI
ncbi:UDP-glucose dehydrogenase family protein [Candidatus Latescibacterota bacterium]